MAHDLIVCSVAHVVQAHRQRARFLLVDGPQKGSGIFLPGQFLVDDVHYCRLR